jgi:hypothetical protein
MDSKENGVLKCFFRALLLTNGMASRTECYTETRDEILKHQFNKRLKSFAPCRWILKKTILPSGIKILTKICETKKNSSLFSIFE